MKKRDSTIIAMRELRKEISETLECGTYRKDEECYLMDIESHLLNIEHKINSLYWSKK